MSDKAVQADALVDISPQERAAYEADVERQRSQWWMSTLKETPNPGTYDTSDFIDELNKNPINNTYSFKTVGRRNSSYPYGRGNLLLPGLYEVPDSYENLRKKPASYNFKAPQRQTLATEVRAPPPNQYHVEKYGTMDGSNYSYMLLRRSSRRSSAFKTEVQRIPVFKPREGPGPGEYEPKLLRQDLVISSSFRSKEQRFKTAASRVPGPGSYDKCCYDRSRSHITKTLNDMGRKNGLFFSYSPVI